MLIWGRKKRSDSHHLGTRACARAQIYNIEPVLDQSSAPHVDVVAEMGWTLLSSCFLPCLVNLNPACLCLCAHQSISAQAISSGPWGHHRRRLCAGALRESKIPKEPVGNQPLVTDPLLFTPSSWMSARCDATSRALPAICQLGQRIPACWSAQRHLSPTPCSAAGCEKCLSAPSTAAGIPQ